jgi:signal transduction histidine kinase/CheY-like chemotaxis protein
MNYTKELESLAKVETLDSLEFRVQFIAVFACVATAVATTGLSILFAWFALHYSLVFLERKLASRFAKLGTPLAFYTIIGLNLAIGITFAWLPVYLWMQGQQSFYFAAMALLVGSTLNTFLIRSSLWYQAVCFVAPNAGAFLLIAMIISGKGLPTGEVVALVVIASAVLFYFLVAVVEMHRMHVKHEHTRDQLLQSQKTEVIGRLTGGVAHDFNNLLNVISGYLEVALSENSETDRNTAIQGALKAATRGGNLVHQLLAFARKARLESRSVSVDTTLTELGEMASRVIPSSIVVDFGHNKSGLFVLADPVSLTTALLNLLLNARDAISGSGRIQLSATGASSAELPAGMTYDKAYTDFVLFTVKDSGHGMSSDLIDRVTEPFFTTKPVGFGSGLGLSMVQGFAQQSGGGIHIASSPGVGTTVYVALPSGTKSDQVHTMPINLGSPDAVTGTVLVVEDQLELLKMISRILGSGGFLVHSASTADEAIALVESGLHPDLLITDAVMPGSLSMEDLVTRVRSVNPSSKLIIMSGYDERQLEYEASGFGEFLFLQKPFSLSRLSSMASEIMSSARSEKSEEPASSSLSVNDPP